jgi:hypothetical protein
LFSLLLYPSHPESHARIHQAEAPHTAYICAFLLTTQWLLNGYSMIKNDMSFGRRKIYS